jgi:beta-galactosidase
MGAFATEDDDAVTLQTTQAKVRLDKRTGALTSFEYKGRELLAGPLVPNFWRVPTDNDDGNQMPRRLGDWKSAAPDSVITKSHVTDPASGLWVLFAKSVPPKNSLVEIGYGLDPRGFVVVSMMLDPNPSLPELPRFGMQLAVPREFDNVTWFGRGPHENYVDRKSSAFVSRYESSIDNFTHTYTRPQENGNRTDVRWIALTDDNGIGLMAIGQPMLSTSDWPYSTDDLAKAMHVNELPRRDFITWNLDGGQMGVGGDDSWGALPHAQYALPAVRRSHTFILRAVDKTMGDLGDLARETRP